MKEKNNDVNKKSLVVIVLFLFILVALVVGVTYQVYLYTNEGSSILNKIMGGDADIFKNGTVTLVYTEGESSVRIENAIPMSDEEGMNLSDNKQLMDFTVSIDIAKSSAVSYEVVAEKDPESTIEDNFIKIYLQRSIKTPTYEEEIMKPTRFNPLKEEDDYGTPAGNMVLDQVTTSESITYYYRLRMWIASDYQLDNTYKKFSIKINVHGKGERIKGDGTTSPEESDKDNNTTTDNNSTTNNNTTTDNSTTNNNTTTDNTTPNGNSTNSSSQANPTE